MNDHKKEETMLPDWMCSGETYVPSKDKEAFLTKSTKSVLSVLAKMRFYEGKDGKFSATPSLKLFYTLLYIVLTACSGNYLFTLIMCAAVTVRLAFFSAKAIRQILRGTAGAVLFSILILLRCFRKGFLHESLLLFFGRFYKLRLINRLKSNCL